MDGSCKLGGGSLVYTCVELRNTLELLKNEEESNSCIKKSYIYKIWSYSIVVVGRNADFVEVGEGKIMWWGKGMRGVIEF